MLGIYERMSKNRHVGVVHVDCYVLQQHCRHWVAAAGVCCGRVCACRSEHVGIYGHVGVVTCWVYMST